MFSAVPLLLTERSEDECLCISSQFALSWTKIKGSGDENLNFSTSEFVSLSLSLSDLKAVGPNSLSSQGNTLSHLVLSKNSLADVPTEAIRQLRNLDHLNLNENNITVLKQGAFIGLGKVSGVPGVRAKKYDHFKSLCFFEIGSRVFSAIQLLPLPLIRFLRLFTR